MRSDEFFLLAEFTTSNACALFRGRTTFMNGQFVEPLCVQTPSGNWITLDEIQLMKFGVQTYKSRVARSDLCKAYHPTKAAVTAIMLSAAGHRTTCNVPGE